MTDITPCKIEGCTRPHRSREMCTLHYDRWRNHDGDTSVGRVTHGMTDTSEYHTWQAMKKRCASPKDSAWYLYGARGITVCERWLESFENFLEDMGRKPTLKHSIDRIDNNGNYEPSNCRWANHTQQNFNQRLRKNHPTGVRGVAFNKKHSKYSATLRVNGQHHYLGSYTTISEAAKARKAGEEKYLRGVL